MVAESPISLRALLLLIGNWLNSKIAQPFRAEEASGYVLMDRKEICVGMGVCKYLTASEELKLRAVWIGRNVCCYCCSVLIFCLFVCFFPLNKNGLSKNERSERGMEERKEGEREREGK